MGLTPPLRLTVNVPLTLTERERIAVGEEVIDYIRNRARRGLGVGNKPLRGPDGDGKYSKSYKESAEFKAAGKTGSKVNLTFSGEMLFAMEVQDVSQAGRVIIGFGDDDNNDKAVFLLEKNYEWFGLTEDERLKIVSKFQGSTTPSIDSSLVESFLRGLFRG